MNTKLKLAAVVATAALALTACGAQDDDCDTTVMYYSTTDGHYHYGSPTGKTVPAYKVPQSARKVPGYKPVGPNKAPKGSSGSSGSKGGYKGSSGSKSRSGRR